MIVLLADKKKNYVFGVQVHLLYMVLLHVFSVLAIPNPCTAIATHFKRCGGSDGDQGSVGNGDRVSIRIIVRLSILYFTSTTSSCTWLYIRRHPPKWVCGDSPKPFYMVSKALRLLTPPSTGVSPVPSSTSP